MTAKEVFLRRLQIQIEALKTSYEANKDLPESFFENLPTSVVIRTDLPSALVTQKENIGSKVNKTSEPVDINEYGAAKKLLLSIFEESGVSLQKHEILKVFSKKTSKTPDEVYNTVTNGLTALKESGEIIGYKPKELKRFKGFFWGLSKWFKDGQPLAKHDAFNEIKDILS